MSDPSIRFFPRPAARPAGAFAARAFAASLLTGAAACAGVLAAYEADMPAPPAVSSREETPGVALRDARGQDFAWAPSRPETGGAVIGLEEASPALGRMLEALETLLWTDEPPGPFAAAAAARLERLFLPPHEAQASEREGPLWRKARQLAARWAYGGDEIRLILLNRAAFGEEAFGFEEAARKWFAHPAARLSLAETAMLVGALGAPDGESPFADLRAARARAAAALDLMRDKGLASSEAVAEALAHPPAPRLEAPKELDFTLWLLEGLPPELRRPETRLTARATIDLRAQEAVDDAIKRVLGKAGPIDPRLQLGAVVLSRDGAVRAMEGARPDRLARGERRNRSADLPRHMGAAVAPILAAEALREGASALDAAAFFEPRSSEADRAAGRLAYGPLSDLFEGLGLARPPQGPAAVHDAIGTPLSLASAWAALLSDGRPTPPCGYSSILAESTGEVVAGRQEPGASILSPDIARRALAFAARRAATDPVVRRAALEGREIAAMAAETSRDLWFVGATADYVAVVWLGRDDGARPGGVGLELAADLWREIMTEVYAVQPLEPRPVLAPLPPQDQRFSALPAQGGWRSLQWPGYLSPE